ncbi:HupE/UreJ family protein [Roseovarius phycicola]|uniref:HupE/UreJ family protein n=1 Tax=Roseovarius phycicola TaxID=3080976 RepID=A0ABZ2HGU4_9RHOB
MVRFLLIPLILTLLRAKSTQALVIGFALLGGPALAHEVRPAVADFEIEDTSLSITVRLNAEAIIAGVNLSQVDDTNDSAQAEDYDTLRTLSDVALADAFKETWPAFADGLKLRAGDITLTPVLGKIDVIPEDNAENPRDTMVSLSAVLPPGGDPLQIGWDARFGSLVLRQGETVEAPFTGIVEPGALSPPLPRVGSFEETAGQNFMRYLISGFDHIIPKGLDHILFVLGLFFFSMQMRPLLIQVSAFTVAHTITLALATLGIVNIPGSIVEPLIALSIVYVAVENIFARRMTPWRPFVIFGFGLLHGLGFASVLGEFGLEPSRFIASLIAFNIGVEVGQLTVIALALLAVGLWFGQKDWYRARIAIPASVVIALIGAYWSFERVFL